MCVCVCVQCLCNNVYMGKTSLSNDVHCCICTLAMGKTSSPYSIVLKIGGSSVQAPNKKVLTMFTWDTFL